MESVLIILCLLRLDETRQWLSFGSSANKYYFLIADVWPNLGESLMTDVMFVSFYK